MTTRELLSHANMLPVPRSHNIDTLGWHDGYMVVKFLGRGILYVYGSAVPESEYVKIMRNPYPDKLFTSIIKNRFKCYKIEVPNAGTLQQADGGSERLVKPLWKGDTAQN